MKKTNVMPLRNHLSSLLDYVQRGKELQIEKRNVPIARIISVDFPTKNRTKLGAGKGTVAFLGSVLDPIPAEDWEMHSRSSF